MKTISSKHLLHARVPKGLVFSSTLLPIFIFEIIRKAPIDVKTAVYADDWALWVTNKNLTDALSIIIQQAYFSGLMISAEKKNTQIHDAPYKSTSSIKN